MPRGAGGEVHAEAGVKVYDEEEENNMWEVHAEAGGKIYDDDDEENNMPRSSRRANNYGIA